MIRIFKNIFLLTLLCVGFSAAAQTTSSSPYSQFGLGDLKGNYLPQQRGMAGISMGFRKPGPYDNINFANPASYSSLALTTFDIGASGTLRKLSKADVSGSTQFNGTLSHINFGIPVSRTSAISFGLNPYSDLGYNFRNEAQVDTTDIQYVYSGEGGLSKAYMGYGIRFGRNFSVGLNVGYLFGNLEQSRALETKDLTGFNSRTEYQNSIGGLSFDYGLQYSADLNPTTKLIIGYAGNAGKDIKSRRDVVTTRYRREYNPTDNDTLELAVVDTTFYSKGSKMTLKMPMSHTVGFAFEKTNKWLFGADVSYTKWSEFREGAADPSLNNSLGIAVGGQITPDIESIDSYWKMVDYRFGFKYDKTFININNNDITQKAITLGMGFPLPSNRSSFYKLNISAELGVRGSHDNNLVRDKFVNIHLGFTLNDRWFQKTYID